MCNLNFSFCVESACLKMLDVVVCKTKNEKSHRKQAELLMLKDKNRPWSTREGPKPAARAR